MNRVYMTGEQIEALADFADGQQVRVEEKARPKAAPGVVQNQFGPLFITRIGTEVVKVEMDENGGIPEPPPPSRDKPTT